MEIHKGLIQPGKHAVGHEDEYAGMKTYWKPSFAKVILAAMCLLDVPGVGAQPPAQRDEREVPAAITAPSAVADKKMPASAGKTPATGTLLPPRRSSLGTQETPSLVPAGDSMPALGLCDGS